MSLLMLILCLSVVGCQPLDGLRGRLALKEGNRAYLAGNYEDALTQYEKTLRYVPDHAEAHRNSGYCLMAMLRKTGDVTDRRRYADRAIAEFLQLSEVNRLERNDRLPSQDKIDQFILTLFLDSQQQEKALSHLEQRHRRHPKDRGTMTMMSDICVDLGRLDDAITWREKCLELEPDRPEAHYAMGVFAWRLSKENRIAGEARQHLIDRGLRALERARELKGEHFESLTFINLLYREKAKYETVEKERTQLEKLADQYQALARELFESGRQEARLLESQSPELDVEH